MAVFYLSIFLIISFAHSAPVENPTEDPPTDYPPTDPTDPPDPRCKAEFWWDQTGFVCNDDKTGYYFCFYDGELQREVLCPAGKRCKCSGGNKCYKDSKDDKIPGTPESEVCELIPPPDRPLPDPARFSYREVYKQVSEDPDDTFEKILSGEVRQDIKNGKYMDINGNNSDFHMVLGHRTYTGNLKQKTCKIGQTSKPGPYWNLKTLLGGYKLHRESKNGAVTSQMWTKPGTVSRYDPVEHFWVSVKDGFTSLVQYSVSEGRDWDDPTMFVSSDKDIYYKTTYGVDSSHWFDIPHFCL